MPLMLMRAPTGEVAKVEPAEVDLFRRNGAVLLGPAPDDPVEPDAQPGGPGFLHGGRMTSPKIPLPGEQLPQEPPPPMRTGAMNMMSAPYTAVSGAVGRMFDQPATAGTGQRMQAAMSGGGEAFARSPFETKAISEEARQRGVETGWAGAMADVMGDPGNVGNPVLDVVKLAKAGVTAAHALPALGAFAMAAGKGRKAWLPVLEQAFPLKDSFGKLKGFIKPDKIPEMMRAATGATPEMIEAAEKLSLKAKGKPMRAQAIIDALTGKKHDPGRILYDMKTVPKGTKPLPGAPLWVDSPEKEAESLRGYLQLVLDGVKGRNFYREAGKAILEHAGDNPDRAYRFSGGVAITSPSTDVAGNTGHAVKGHNQAISGMPVKTGMFSNVMGKTVKKLYEGVAGALGPKREPFVRQLAMGGEFATEAQRTHRAVHDFWEGEAFRYVNPDGTPKRAGFGPAQHAWMDKMTDAAITEANATKMGGFDDWDAGTLQAAAWTGAKLRAGNIKAGDAAKSYADYLRNYYMQEGREFVPGSSTGHLVGLADNPQALDAYVKRVTDRLYDTKGREKSAMAKDMMVGGSHEGPGVWLGETSPGRQVNQMAGIQTSDLPVGQSRRVDDASMGLIEHNASQYAMNMGQAAAAGTMLDYGAAAGIRDAYDMKLPTGVLKMNDPVLQNPALKAAVAAGRVVPIATPEGIRILNLGMLNRAPGVAKTPEARRIALLNAAEAPKSRATAAARTVPLTTEQARREAAVNAGEVGTRMSELRAGVSGEKFNKFRLDQAVELGSGGKAGKLETAPGKNIGFYIENNWSIPEGAAGQAFARKILAIPNGEAMFNATAPAEAKALNEIDFYLRDNFGIPLSETIHRLRNAIIENGMDGVRALAKQYGAPLAVLMALASQLGLARPPQEQGAH